jgi:uncharacterized membrane protein YhhN
MLRLAHNTAPQAHLCSSAALFRKAAASELQPGFLALCFASVVQLNLMTRNKIALKSKHLAA